MSRRAGWAVVVAVAFAVPLALFAANGLPSFPSREDCVRPVTGDGVIEAVFGYRDSELEARELRDRALYVGFDGTEVERDACGRARVFVGEIPSLEVGNGLVRSARSVGLEVTLEQAG